MRMQLALMVVEELKYYVYLSANNYNQMLLISTLLLSNLHRVNSNGRMFHTNEDWIRDQQR